MASVVAITIVMGLVLHARASQPSTDPPQNAAAKPTGDANQAQSKPSGQARVLVTISRSTGDKKTASLPFTLWANLNGDPTTLNAGQFVAVPTSVVSTAGGEDKAPRVVPYSMQSVGTRITCQVKVSSDARFLVSLQVRDTYLTPAKQGVSELATVKSLETINNLVLRDGQTADFATSTDITTGEVTRIDVTVTTLK
jgi:hypothetical protein